MLYVFLCLWSSFVTYGFMRINKDDGFSKIDKKITKELGTHPTKYNDEYSFGYSIGLIRCSQLVHDVKYGRK